MYVTRRLPHETTSLPWRVRMGPEPWQGSVKQWLYGLWMLHRARRERIMAAAELAWQGWLRWL